MVYCVVSVRFVLVIWSRGLFSVDWGRVAMCPEVSMWCDAEDYRWAG